MTAPRPLPQLLRALAAAAAAHPLERKLLVCRRASAGREILRSLSAHGVPWINFEVTTPLQLAHELVAAELVLSGERLADEFDEAEHADAAIDAVLRGSTGRLAELAEAPGLRRAIASSLRTLRGAGIDAALLDATRFRDEEKRGRIAAMIREYETRLAAARLVDAAGVYARALAALDRGAAALPAQHVLIVPGIAARGLSGELLRRVIAHGARVLSADPVHGLRRPDAWLVDHVAASDPAVTATALSWLNDPDGWPAPAASAVTTPAGSDVILDVFAASSVATELREVLRRVIASGLRWDEVEIIATDAHAYGVALDGLASRLGIPVTYAAGLPIARTRPGRAAAAWLEWVQRGYPAAVLREMLERGDIAVPGVSGASLARRLRSLAVTGGPERYAAAVAARITALDQPQPDDDARDAAERAEDSERARAELSALGAVVQALFAAVPPRTDGSASPAGLAAGMLALLDLTTAATPADSAARLRMTQRLERLAATGARVASAAGAFAAVQAVLDDHVPAPPSGGGPAWIAAGGHLHLSDIEHGGHAARTATFIVGLDAVRFPGAGGTDSLLVDDDRRRLTAGQTVPALPQSEDRVDEVRYALASLAARLRGRVTFSYATWDAVEGRGIAPAAELLQVYRLMTGDSTADYETLHAATSPAASAVPRGSGLIDEDDVWLHALAADDGRGATILRRGVTAVCAAYPGLEAGATAWKQRRRARAPGAHHGVIEPRPGHDPRTEPARPVSATRLQTLGACPHRYLLRYILRVRPPEDPELSPEQWLSPRDRGRLLHAVFEHSLRQVRDDRIAVDDSAFDELVRRTLDAQVAALRAAVPPRGEAIFQHELAHLHEDARAFVAMVREDGARFIALEHSFGRDGNAPVSIGLPDGSSLLLEGAIDRIDRLEDGRLAVIDYKTGSTFRFGGSTGVLDGGRRLQHVLYAAAAARLHGAPVARAEYHFPTRRSQSHRVRYDARSMSDGLAVVVELLELVRRGWFIPTNTPDDCRYCDYAAVCRARTDAWERTDSPLAVWSREAEGDAADRLRRIRR